MKKIDCKETKNMHFIVFIPIMQYLKCLPMQDNHCVFDATSKWGWSGDSTLGFYITLTSDQSFFRAFMLTSNILHLELRGYTEMWHAIIIH